MSLHNFIGQEALKPIIEAEVACSKVFPHTLLFGMPGIGKTTLAKIIAGETKSSFIPIMAGKEWTERRVITELLRLDKSGYTKGGRNETGKRYIVFIDEVHLLPTFEPWYTVLERRVVSFCNAVSWVPEITVIGATTDAGKLPKPFRDRFKLPLNLKPYTESELCTIVKQKFKDLKDETVISIVRRSRRTPRIALNYAERVKVSGLKYFDAIGVDENGLTEVDQKILACLQNSSKPLSANTLSAMCNISVKDLTELYEPFLMEQGLIVITPQGRIPMTLGSGEVTE